MDFDEGVREREACSPSPASLDVSRDIEYIESTARSHEGH